MLAAFVFRELLLQQVGQGIVKAILLKVRAGDARRVILRPQVVLWKAVSVSMGYLFKM